MFREYFKIFCCLFSKALKQMLLLDRETGALCAMKEVELFPDDPKSAECIKQLEQVGCPLLAFYHYLIGSCVRCTNCVECCVSCVFFVITVHIIFVNRTLWDFTTEICVANSQFLWNSKSLSNPE